MAGLNERYAKALLDLTLENGDMSDLLSQASFICDTLNMPDVISFMSHPHIPNKDKYVFFENVFAGKVNKDFIGFLSLVVKKNRESIIIPVLSEYISCLNKKLGIAKSTVVSAAPLSDIQLEQIRKLLSKKTGMKVELETKIDPDVIGGFYILADGYIYDKTVRTELNQIKESLKRGIANGD